jgi:hypothetical protein
VLGWWVEAAEGEWPEEGGSGTVFSVFITSYLIAPGTEATERYQAELVALPSSV